jgi:preprotein translocase subunit SecF
MEVLIISALSIVLIFLAFILGLHYGSKIKSGEVIEMPNPVKKVQQYKSMKKVEEKLDKEALIEEINLANIDSYDGTELGQQSFPNE